MRRERRLSVLSPSRVVGDAQPRPIGMEIDVEPRFTYVDTDVDLVARLVRARPCLACGTCSPSSVQDKREGRTDQALPRRTADSRLSRVGLVRLRARWRRKAVERTAGSWRQAGS